MSQPEWIAVDWGTSRLRAYPMMGETAGEEISSDRGMGSLERSEFERMQTILATSPAARSAVDQAFIDANPVENVRFRLAGGLLGILAAVNEEVEYSYWASLIAVFTAISLRWPVSNTLTVLWRMSPA